MLTIIGNSPSSGSTFLGDLLDCSPYSACGPELGLFSNRHLYSLRNKLRDFWFGSTVSSYYLNKAYIDGSVLPFYGLNKDKFNLMLSSSPDIHYFVKTFHNYFFSFRGKNPRGIWFEKTPQNISCIDLYLRTFPSYKFVHIARDPRYVYTSLLKRGFTPYKAAATWLIDVAKFLKYQSHKHVINITYEDLVKNPFNLVSHLINQITGFEATTPSEIEEGHKKNTYRQIAETRIDSWSVRVPAKVINASAKPLELKNMQSLASFLSMKISKGYAKLFELPEISFKEAALLLGYNDAINELIKLTPIKAKNSTAERLRTSKKLLFDCYNRNARLTNARSYYCPLVKAET